MKNGRYALYQGKEYTFGIRKDGKFILRSSDIGDLAMGFEECEPFKVKGTPNDVVCLKFVDRNELSEFYRVRTYAIYKGYRFDAIDEKDNMVSIVTMTGDYRNWLSLGMDCIEKGVYQKWVQKNEIDIKVVKEEL